MGNLSLAAVCRWATYTCFEWKWR